VRAIVAGGAAVAGRGGPVTSGAAPVGASFPLDSQRIAFRSPEVTRICESISFSPKPVHLGSAGKTPCLDGVGVTVQAHDFDYGRGPAACGVAHA
jgi:hypothetical protein